MRADFLDGTAVTDLPPSLFRQGLPALIERRQCHILPLRRRMNLSAHHIACTKLLRRCDVMDQSALHIRVRERRARLGREERLITIRTQPVVSGCRCPRDGQRRLHGNHARQ